MWWAEVAYVEDGIGEEEGVEGEALQMVEGPEQWSEAHFGAQHVRRGSCHSPSSKSEYSRQGWCTLHVQLPQSTEQLRVECPKAVAGGEREALEKLAPGSTPRQSDRK